MELQNISDEGLAERLRVLEERVNALEAAFARDSGSDNGGTLPLAEDATGEEARQDGWVHFSGSVTRAGQELSYEWKRPVSELANQQWHQSIQRLSSLAHPVRGAILQELLEGPRSVADLVNAGIVTSTGAAYHHLNELTNGGWLSKMPQGIYQIPPARVVPLYVLIAAGEDH